MKPSIQERMERQISKVEEYNTLFDVVVTQAETSLSTQAANPADNQYVITTGSFITTITCNDNDWAAVTVNIDVPALDMSSRVADIQINVSGQMEEDYHNMPRNVRAQVLALIDDIYEAIQAYIDNNTTNTEEEN